MVQNDLLDWYETSLSVQERKLRGHFSTPAHLVAQILDACHYTPAHDLAHIRVLDPACGSGNFVAGAAQRLIAYGQRAGLSDVATANLLRRNLWGFDPDPVACFLADMQVRSTFSVRSKPGAEPDINEIDDLQPTPNKEIDVGQLHIHQADGLALPWTHAGQVDLLLANPPYLAAKNSDLSVYRLARQRGQADSYLLFLELALQIVRPGGWLGLVLPDPVLARSNATHERKRLLAETTVHHLWHLADVFAAYVGAVVIVAQKIPPTPLHHIAWRRERWRQDSGMPRIDRGHAHETQNDRHGTVSQALLQLQTGGELRYLLSRLQGTLVEQIYVYTHTARQQSNNKALILLKDIAHVHRGEELSKESPLLSKLPALAANEAPEDWLPVLRGGSDIRPYGVPCADYWIARDKVVKPLTRYLTPKLLVVKSAGKLQASLDLHGHVVLQTLYMLSFFTFSPFSIPTRIGALASDPNMQESKQEFSLEDDLYYLLALLNSRLLEEYVYVLHTAYKWVQPQIEQSVLAQLPVPASVDATEKEQIIRRAKHMMHACSESSSGVELKEQNRVLYEEQERAICRLYQTAIQERRPAVPEQPADPAVRVEPVQSKSRPLTF
ncbi:MAG: hypothetical protein NVS2B12_09940 [Ktedonobacteraceae bacterium]